MRDTSLADFTERHRHAFVPRIAIFTASALALSQCCSCLAFASVQGGHHHDMATLCKAGLPRFDFLRLRLPGVPFGVVPPLGDDLPLPGDPSPLGERLPLALLPNLENLLCFFRALPCKGREHR